MTTRSRPMRHLHAADLARAQLVPEGSFPTGTSRRSSTSPKTSGASPGPASTSPSRSPSRCWTARSCRTWLHSPNAGSAGLLLRADGDGPVQRARGQVPLHDGRDPADCKRAHDQVYLKQKFDEFEQRRRGRCGPGSRTGLFIRRHFVRDPSFGVIQKPGLVGQLPAALPGPEHRRPLLRLRDVPSPRHRRRPRGARRAHLAEDILGRRLSAFEEAGATEAGPLEGRVALVTGAGRGIGEAIAAPARARRRGRGRQRRRRGRRAPVADSLPGRRRGRLVADSGGDGRDGRGRRGARRPRHRSSTTPASRATRRSTG